MHNLVGSCFSRHTIIVPCVIVYQFHEAHVADLRSVVAAEALANFWKTLHGSNEDRE